MQFSLIFYSITNKKKCNSKIGSTKYQYDNIKLDFQKRGFQRVYMKLFENYFYSWKNNYNIVVKSIEFSINSEFTINLNTYLS